MQCHLLVFNSAHFAVAISSGEWPDDASKKVNILVAKICGKDERKRKDFITN